MDSMFCSFNPGSDAARRDWYEGQMKKLGEADDRTKKPTIERKKKRREKKEGVGV